MPNITHNSLDHDDSNLLGSYLLITFLLFEFGMEVECFSLTLDIFNLGASGRRYFEKFCIERILENCFFSFLHNKLFGRELKQFEDIASIVVLD